MTTTTTTPRNMEKQMGGCMAGFLHLFDRNQILTGKRLCSAKRLPPPPMTETTSESERSTPTPTPASPVVTRELVKPKQSYEMPPMTPKSPLPLPIFETKQGTKSSWKFCKEAPRLSLDSRATTDAKGGLHPKEIRTSSAGISRCDSIGSDVSDCTQQNQSPSVIARLMGLEPLPNSNSTNSAMEKKPELRRSASESRVSRDLFHSRFINESNNNYYSPAPPVVVADPRSITNSLKKVEPHGLNLWKAPLNRKSFFDSGDVFPEPKQSVAVYGEIEKRLRMRGIDETSKDLETLKQILEALQLKGLLHSRKVSEQSYRNFVYEESPIVVMKPGRSSSSTLNNQINRRTVNNQVRRNYSENSPSVSPRNVKSPIRAGRSLSPTPNTKTENNAGSRRSNSLVKPKPLSVETQRKSNNSPVHSPKLNPRRIGSDSTPVNNRSPRSKKPTANIYKEKIKINSGVITEDETSSITTSTDTERSKTEEYKEGQNLLERCDKLLNSIAEMNANDLQPSPVSVLDSSFYKDESLTPSPVTTKRNIDFKDHSGELVDDESWSPVISPIRSKFEEISEDCDFVYISVILRAFMYLPEDADVFLLLEKQQYYKGSDTSRVSRLQRKLVFDTVIEILDRSRRLPPWKIASWRNDITTKPSLEKVWGEFQRIREQEAEAEASEDLFEMVCGVLKKDLDTNVINGWGDCSVEMSEVVLDIERLVFKDLISETIGDLATLASRISFMPRRKLVF